MFFRHVFPACSKGLLSQDAKFPQRAGETQSETACDSADFSLRKRRIRDDKHLRGC